MTWQWLSPLFEAKAQWPDANDLSCTRRTILLTHRPPPNSERLNTLQSSPPAESKPLVRLSDSDVAYVEYSLQAYSLWVFYGVDLETRHCQVSQVSTAGSPKRHRSSEAALHGGELQNHEGGKKVGPIPG